mgnify:CR=1 FL=1
MTVNDRLSHLDRLEAEAIHILREVAAEFRNPVMLYSIGKDSSVLLHLKHRDSTTPTGSFERRILI